MKENNVKNNVTILHMYCKKHKTQEAIIVTDFICCKKCYKEWENIER